MFGWMRNFYKRHRKKIIFTGVVVGGSYLLTKYVGWKVNDWQEQKVKEYSLQMKKNYHFESNQRTCTLTFMSFLPNLRNSIADTINTEELLELLKTRPPNKLEIWEKLKVLSISQVVCSVVSNVILLVFLKVELNIIAGYMFKESAEKIVNDKSMDTSNEGLNEIQEQYLNNIRYFLEVKVHDLMECCLKATTEVVREISLKEKISYQKFEQILHEVKANIIKSTFDSKHDKHPLAYYMVNQEWSSVDVQDTYSKMTSETVNLLESADCAKVIDKCLENGFTQLLSGMKSSFHGTEEDPEAILSLDHCIKHDYYKPISLPLAKVLPLCNNVFHDIFKAGKNNFLDSLFAENLLREYSTNIYEAFSKEY